MSYGSTMRSKAPQIIVESWRGLLPMLWKSITMDRLKDNIHAGPSGPWILRSLRSHRHTRKMVSSVNPLLNHCFAGLIRGIPSNQIINQQGWITASAQPQCITGQNQRHDGEGLAGGVATIKTWQSRSRVAPNKWWFNGISFAKLVSIQSALMHLSSFID